MLSRHVFVLAMIVSLATAVVASETHSPRRKPLDIVAFTATPNPATIGTSIHFQGSYKGTAFSGSIDFGDGTFLSLTEDLVKNGVDHTYTTAGVFQVRVQAFGESDSDSASVFVIVGRGSVVNPLNGLSMTATDANGASRDAAGSRFAGGVVNVGVNITRTFGSSATTDFDDIPGRQSVAVPGLNVSHTFTQKGIFVATSHAADFSGVEVAKMRKMLVISSNDTAESGALADAPNTSIVMKKLTGKFLFTKNTPDQVAFSGMVVLPAGFDVNRADGNSVTVGIGNVVDTFVVDAKGKATLPGSAGKVSKAKIKFPKLAGPAAGGESAQIDFTISVADLDVNGFDTEGITASLRTDELQQKVAERFIQIGLVLGGAAYENVVPVQYKVSSKGDAGAIAGRVSKPGKK